MLFRRGLPVFLVAVVTVSLGCSCSSRAQPKEVHVLSNPVIPSSNPAVAPPSPVVPPPSLPFARIDPASTECPHASSTRSGRVVAASRAYGGLALVARVDGDPRLRDAPRFIDVPPNGGDVVIERPNNPGQYEVRHSSGALAFLGSLERGHALARDEALYVAGRATSWSGTIDPVNAVAYFNPLGEQLACAVHDQDVRTLVVNMGLQENHAVPTTADPSYATVTAWRLKGANSTVRLKWTQDVHESGVGAIDGGAQTVVALPSGRLIVFAPEGSPRDEGVVTLDAPIDPGATDLSVVPPFALVLYGGGDAGPLVQRRSKGVVTSRLDARRLDGSLAWRAPLPFLATQPALDGNGRVYVVGTGIAALDMEGHTLWSLPSATPLRAAAFGDGTLAVVRGSEVQIVGVDGHIRQSLRAQEELTTYPAIAADGAVWVASARALYVVR